MFFLVNFDKTQIPEKFVKKIDMCVVIPMSFDMDIARVGFASTLLTIM